MKRVILSIIIIVMAVINANSQSLNNSFFVGKWKVKHFELLKTDEVIGDMSKVEELKDLLLKSNFEFFENGKFNFNIDLNELSIKNNFWNFNSDDNTITIKENKDFKIDRDLIMQFLVEKNDSKVYFILSDFPIVLEVYKD